MDELPEDAGRGLKWLAFSLVGIFLAALLYPMGRYAWEHRPMDDRMLFETRCVGCHRLPSLERTRDWNWGAVVANMRYLNGADAVISDEEAGRIANYLMQQHEKRWTGRSEVEHE